MKIIAGHVVENINEQSSFLGQYGKVVNVLDNEIIVDYPTQKGWRHLKDTRGLCFRLVGDEKIHTNEKGGMQSDIGAAYHLIPPAAIAVVARVFAEGAKKYAPNNWKLIPTEEHINHQVNHAYKHLSGDTTEEHLAHAACRALMALAMHLESKDGV